MQDFRFLRALSVVYTVVAWLGAVGGVIALLSSQISDKTTGEGVGKYAQTVTEKGIGFTGVLTILAAVAVHFVVFMGLAELVKLMLAVEEKTTSSGRRLAEMSILLGEIKANQKQTAEHVRMVGELVYDEANK